MNCLRLRPQGQGLFGHLSTRVPKGGLRRFPVDGKVAGAQEPDGPMEECSERDAAARGATGVHPKVRLCSRPLGNRKELRNLGCWTRKEGPYFWTERHSRFVAPHDHQPCPRRPLRLFGISCTLQTSRRLGLGPDRLRLQLPLRAVWRHEGLGRIHRELHIRGGYSRGVSALIGCGLPSSATARGVRPWIELEAVLCAAKAEMELGAGCGKGAGANGSESGSDVVRRDMGGIGDVWDGIWWAGEGHVPGVDLPLWGWGCGTTTRSGEVVGGYSCGGSRENRMVWNSRRGRGTLDPSLPLQEPVCPLVSLGRDTIVSGDY